MKPINFYFSAKLSNMDYNEWNKPNTKSLAHIETEKSLGVLRVPKNELSGKSKSKI